MSEWPFHRRTPPNTLATATFGAFQVIPASAAPTATLTSAPTVAGPQLRPYQFTVTYNDATAIKASTIAGSNITVTGPGGYSQQATLVSTGLTNGSAVAAVYSVTGLTTPGQYAVNLGANQVSNTAGQFVAGGPVGNFNFAADTSAPTARVTSAPAINSSTTVPYAFQVAYTDNNAIDASTIKTGNIIVTGPGGFSQVATLASTNLTSGPNVAATYNLNPLPTTPGTYTITQVANQVTDLSGNAIAGGTVLGTFTVGAPNVSTGAIVGLVLNADGRILKGRTIFLDLNQNGVLDPSEPTAISDSSSTFAFRNLTPGTYSVVEAPVAGRQALEPTGGKQSVTVTAGQIVFGPRFVDIAANTAGSTNDLTIAFASSPTATAVAGARATVTITITNNGSTKISKRAVLALLASTDGTIGHKVAALSLHSISLHLAAKASKTFTLAFHYPKTLPAGSYRLVAVVDPDGAVAESNKLNNSGVSSAVTVTA